MKNERYLDIASEELEHHFEQNADDIKKIALAAYDKCQEIAKEESEIVSLNVDEDVLFDLAMIAHSKDITLNELIVQCLEKQIEREAMLKNPDNNAAGA